MKERSSVIVAVLLLLLAASVAHASVEWTLKSQLNFEASPLQMVPAADGKTVFVLIPGKILIYSVPDKKVVDFVPVDRKFDRLTVSGKDKVFILASSKDSSISVYEIKKVLNLSGHDFKGPQDAPVVVAVFSDYQ
jgi:hypothetical protein